MIEVSCLCGKKFRAKDELAGRQVKCPECGQSFVVPSAKAEADDPFLVDLAGFEDQQAAANDPLGLGGAGATPQQQPMMQQPVMQQPMMQQPMAGYDQMGNYQAPAQPKRRKSGGGKTGFYIAVGAGGIAGVAALVALVFLVMNLAVSPHERLIKKSLGLIDQIASAMEKATDSNAERTAKKIERLTKKLMDVAKKGQSLEKPAASVDARLKKKYESKLIAAQSRLTAAMKSLTSKPAVMQRIGQALASGAGSGSGRLPFGLQAPRSTGNPFKRSF